MSLPDPRSITGKGTTLKAAIAYVEARHGPEGIERLASALGQEAGSVVGGLILPSAKYPLALLVEVYEAIDRVFGSGDLALCRDLGRFSGEYQVNMLHKLFLQAGKVDYWLKMAAATWGHYYSAGKLSTGIEETEGVLTLRDFNPISKAFCKRFEGWVERVVELGGLRDVGVTHPECVLDGAPACVWRGHWHS